MESDVTRVARGSAYLAIQGVVTTLVGAVALAFSARILTQREMGITVVLTLILGIAQILSDLGFSNGLAKHIAEYRGKNVEYTFILFSGIVVKASLAGFIGLLCITTAPQLSKFLLSSDSYAILFQLIGIDVMLVCINVTVRSFLLGLNKIPEMATLDVTRSIMRYSSTIALLLLGYGLPGLIAGWIIGESVYAISSIIIISKDRHFRMHSIKETTSYLKTLARFSWPLFLASIVVFLYNWFDRAILLAYLPLTEVAVYNVAFMAFGVISIMPTALSTTLFPYYTEQYGKNRHGNIAVGVHAASRYIAFLFTPLALGLAITANPAITLFAGQMYASGDVILFILSLSATISSLGAALGGLLLVYNMTRMTLVINIVSVGVSLTMSLVLLPFLGVTGIAVVRAVAMIFSFVLTFLVLRRRTSIEFDKVAIWKSWVAAAIMFVTVGLVEQVYTSRYLLPLLILVGGTVYVVALRLLKAVNEDDIELVRKLLGNRAIFITKILQKIFF